VARNERIAAFSTYG